MILPFMTKFPASAGALAGKPTAFIDKIWQGWLNQDADRIHKYFEFKDEFKSRFTGTQKFQCWDRHDSPLYKMQFWNKLHTIREDKADRWKRGVVIDFFINARTKDMFRFAPRIPVVSIQKIQILWDDPCLSIWKFNDRNVAVVIDGYRIHESNIGLLAKNDGFDSLDEFFEYFDKDFSGKIIHWTDLKY